MTDELGEYFFFLVVMIYNKKNLSPVSTDRNQPWPPGKTLKLHGVNGKSLEFSFKRAATSSYLSNKN